MAKEAISVTLRRENLAWLRGQLRLRRARSVSDMLDAVVEAARQPGRLGTAARSVKGSIRIAEDDPNLERADDVVRALFDRQAPFLPRARCGAAQRHRR